MGKMGNGAKRKGKRVRSDSLHGENTRNVNKKREADSQDEENGRKQASGGSASLTSKESESQPSEDPESSCASQMAMRAPPISSPSPFIILHRPPGTRPAIKFNLGDIRKALSVGDLRDLGTLFIHDMLSHHRFPKLTPKGFERFADVSPLVFEGRWNESPFPTCNRLHIPKVMVVNIPGLHPEVFVKSIKRCEGPLRLPGCIQPHVPTHGLPHRHVHDLAPHDVHSCIAPVADIFGYMLPVIGPGDRNRLVSVSSSFATMGTPPKSQVLRDAAGLKQNEKCCPSALLLSYADLVSNQYCLHPVYTGKPAPEGWFATDVAAKSLFEEANCKLLAVDCEMCYTENGLELTRVSVVDEGGSTVLDELVLPEKPILDYNTRYSGITAEDMKDVKVRLHDIQKRLAELVDHKTILVGHSLENDLNALRILHPFVIDTAICYSHPCYGNMNKPSLRSLAKQHLGRAIQAGTVSLPGADPRSDKAGHCSLEDARACIDLVKLKLSNGPAYGRDIRNHESILERLRRGDPSRDSAWVDSSKVCAREGHFANYRAIVRSDVEALEKALEFAVKPDVSFLWCRFREVEESFHVREASNAVSGLPDAANDPATSVNSHPPPSESKIEYQEENSQGACFERCPTPTSERHCELLSCNFEQPLEDHCPDGFGSSSDAYSTIDETPAELKKTASTFDSACSTERPDHSDHSNQEELARDMKFADPGATRSAVHEALSRTRRIFDSLPVGSILIAFSANGDVSEMVRMQRERIRLRGQGKWTDEMQRALQKAVGAAKRGCAFIAIRQ